MALNDSERNGSQSLQGISDVVVWQRDDEGETLEGTAGPMPMNSPPKQASTTSVLDSSTTCRLLHALGQGQSMR